MSAGRLTSGRHGDDPVIVGVMGGYFAQASRLVFMQVANIFWPLAMNTEGHAKPDAEVDFGSVLSQLFSSSAQCLLLMNPLSVRLRAIQHSAMAPYM